MIWCVDDDNTIRDIEVYTLTQTGFEAKGFADGISMLEALKTEKPELIVLDIMLPGKDGVEILKEIKSNPEICTFRRSYRLRRPDTGVRTGNRRTVRSRRGQQSSPQRKTCMAVSSGNTPRSGFHLLCPG